MINQRLSAIEASAKKQGRSSQGDAWYQMRASVSNPPDTRVHIRGAWMQGSVYLADRLTVWLPSISCDFSSTDQFAIDASHAYDGNFGNAHWYKPVLLCYNYDYYYVLVGGLPASYPTYDKPFCIPGLTSPEYETAVEAEDGIITWMETDTGYLNYSDMPICIIVLRNNGATGTPGAVQAIDAVNRGRSYLWRDMRMRNRTEYYDGAYG